MGSPTAPTVYYARRARSYISELWRRREFVWFLATGNFKARNASTTLGLFWWVLNPLLLGAIYYLVFGILFGARGPGYVGYLMTGMFVFHFTHHSMTGGANSILQNSKLIANLKFPRLILPISSLIEALFGFLTSLLVLIGIVFVIDGILPGPHMAILLVIVPIQVLFNLGLGCLAARLAVPFRDVTNFLPYVSRLWLYLSPVIWPLTRLDNISAKLATVIEINPMYSLLSVYRAAMLGSPLDWSHVGVAALWALGALIVGVAPFVKYEGHMVRYL